ncbi:MAG: FtsX-like permease family protein [Rhizobiales bacterium]|nr:FtsX-like permease family protein [Hyphomicrobiales bacterium]
MKRDALHLAVVRVPGFLALRLAFRELRGGLQGFYVFIACIALGVMAIAGVGSFSRSLTDGLAREGSVILGGDAVFTLIHREARGDERTFLESLGHVSSAATMRAMARARDERTALVEIKAVDDAYPLYGVVEIEPAMPLTQAITARDGAFGAAADPALIARLDLKVGDRLTVGAATIEIRAILKAEPDRLAGGVGFGPRLLMNDAALRATGLLQPGSLVRWHYRLRIPDDTGQNATAALLTKAEAHFPEAGWDIRTRSNASPQLARNIERFTQFLTLVGLTALLVGGVGVANAVKGHLDRRRDIIAVMKALGATGARVFVIYLAQVLLLAAIGSVIGIVLGAILPFAISAGFGHLVPLPIEPALHPSELALAGTYGLLTALAFALWPLGRAHDISVSALFRDEVAPTRRLPRSPYIFAAIGVITLLAALAILLAYDRRIAAIFVAAAAGVFVALHLVAWLLMAMTRRLPHAKAAVVRLAVANIHRPGALTPTIVLSLGLGVALLVTVIEIDFNLRRQFTAALPDKAPSFYFIDIPDADAGRFDAFVRARAPGAGYERVPMLRGRIVAANGIKADDIKPSPSAAWVLQSDRGITYSGDIPRGSRLVEGEWWGTEYRGPPLISFEKKLAEGLGLKLNDPVTVNVLGRNITARIANMRVVDWESLGINFVMVFSPNAFAGAPHIHIATLTYPGGGTLDEENVLLKAVADGFASVTTVRVKDALEAIGNLVTNLILGIRAASTVTLLAAVLVLGGALAAGHRGRVYDAVILKTLGATRMRLIMTYALEYLMLGFSTALFGVAAGSIAAWLVVTEVMTLSFVWLPGPASVAAVGAILVTVVFGLFGTFKALGQKPAPVLRNL